MGETLGSQNAGYVDGVIDNQIAGWVKPQVANASHSVDLLVDGELISTTRSNLFRQDLVGTASNDGRNAFVIPVPAALCDGTTRAVEVRLSGTSIPLEFGRFDFSHVFVYPSPVVVTKPHPRLAQRAKHVLSLLKPMDVIEGRLVRRGRANDGGYVMLDHGLEAAVAYSLGINDDVSWDLEIAEAGCQVFQYDHTISALPEQHPNFHWSKIGISGASSKDGAFKSIGDLIKLNEHIGRNDLILKMDIEGHEWEAIDALSVENLEQFSQIVAEFHSFSLIDDDIFYSNIASVLEKINSKHTLIHVHANNCGWLGILGGVMLADTLEVTYVRTGNHAFKECKAVFPTTLDMPCNPNAADYYLGPIGQNATI